MKKGISRSLGVFYCCTACVVLGLLFVAASFAVMKYNSHNQQASISKRLKDISTAVDASIPLPLWQLNNVYLQDFITALCSSEDIIYVSIIGTEGYVLESHDNAYSGKTYSHFDNSSDYIVSSRPIFFKNFKIGEFRVALESKYYSSPYAHDTLFMICLVIASTTITATLSFLFLHYRVVLPLNLISSNLEFKQEIEDDLQIIHKNDDEIGFLVEILRKYLKNTSRLTKEKTSSADLKAVNNKLKMEIIERHQAEKLLRLSEEKFRYVLNNSPDTIYTIDLVSGRYEYISPSCTNTTGYSPKELIHQGLKGILPNIHRDDRTRLKKHFMENLSKGKSTSHSSSIEYRFKHKELGYRYISDTRTVIFDKRQNPISIIGSARDITDQKTVEIEREKLQKKLRQSQKMEAIGTLAGGIAHDFNNILGAILGYADMAKEDIPPGSSVDRDLNEIIRAGDRAKELVRQILSYSRKEPHKQTNVSISSIVKETIKLLRATIPANITITLDIDPLCGNILAEPTQIHQVLMNLCSNASHAVERNENGNIHISLRRESGFGVSSKEVSLIPDKYYVVLRVRDNGIGIAPSILERIFDPYFTTKEVGKGSGMGLTVVTGIIRSHGGCISAQSVSGEYTEFTVYFPEVPVEDDIYGKAKKPLTSGKGSILLIDDEVSIVNITQRRLERLGYEVTAYSKSRDALLDFQARQYDYDLLITDQTMPDLTGDQLSMEVLKLRPSMPIIICTGYSEKIDEQRAKDVGIKTLLMKPVDKYDLAEAVSKLLVDVEKMMPSGSSD